MSTMETPERCVKSGQSLNKKTPERRQQLHQSRSGVFILNFEQISYIVLVFLLLL